MRIEQIIAAVTRSLNIAGVREITRIDVVAHASDLQLCMACVSPGKPVYLGFTHSLMSHQRHAFGSDDAANGNWLAGLGPAAAARLKRPLQAASRLGLAKRDSAKRSPRAR